MSKIVWVVAVIFMMMATATLASAAEPKGNAGPTVSEQGSDKGISTEAVVVSETVNKGTAEAVAQVKEGTSFKKDGREYLLRAWGRYGPVSVGEGSSIYRRIYYTTIYGPFLGTPVVVDTLEVRYPQDVYTIYSLGTDRGYNGIRSFDARLAAHDGSLTGAYIDYHAVRG